MDTLRERVNPAAASPAEFQQALREALKPVHHQNACRAIEYPAPGGAFPIAILLGSPLLIVADACELRNDVLYACRNDQRTTLITAANAHDVRIFCARHVINEVFEHAAEWTSDTDVSVDTFLDRWEAEYLPVIRIVDGTEFIETLDPNERRRIEQLRIIDPDDLPSAALSIVIEAFYLSKDENALRAVYGDDLNLEAHKGWLTMLQAGSDAQQLSKMLQAGVVATNTLTVAVASGVRRLVYKAGPWISLACLALLVLAVMMAPRDKRRKVSDGVYAAAGVALEVSQAHTQLMAAYRAATPGQPGWEQLAQTLSDELLRLRACLHTLARSPDSNLSPTELSSLMPTRRFGAEVTVVEALLSVSDCCEEVWVGYWQLGVAHEHVLASIPELEE